MSSGRLCRQAGRHGEKARAGVLSGWGGAAGAGWLGTRVGAVRRLRTRPGWDGAEGDGVPAAGADGTRGLTAAWRVSCSAQQVGGVGYCGAGMREGKVGDQVACPAAGDPPCTAWSAPGRREWTLPSVARSFQVFLRRKAFARGVCGDGGKRFYFHVFAYFAFSRCQQEIISSDCKSLGTS